ncbi:Processing alpha glucosidase I [Polyrhizophydium stewartii]|uniref:Mannosyl-oligosaccharide glucosidase n=1 Tax=Polyrhizophydium stewartii TaxID=2732419 RepID=A0ABR4MZ76_9FUNG
MIATLALLALAHQATAVAGVGTEDAEALHAAVHHAQNQSLLWGTYRPNLYFGARTRTPETLLTGLMWHGLGGIEGRPWENIRHTCEQDDKLSGYAWGKHDGRSFGTQEIRDRANNVTIRTEFVKVGGGEHGGDWAVRITGTPTTSEHADVSILFYAGLDGPGDLSVEKGDAFSLIRGKSKSLGGFGLVIREGKDNQPPPLGAFESRMGLPKLDQPDLIQISVPHKDVWRIKDVVQQRIISYAQKVLNDHRTAAGYISLPNLLRLGPTQAGGNVAVFQKALRAPFQIDVAFMSESAREHSGRVDPNDAEGLTGDKLAAALAKAEQSFDERFERTFGLQERGYSESEIKLGKMLLGNMVGSIGYFYGTSIVDRAWEGFVESEPIDYLDVAEPEEDADDEYFSGDKLDVPRPKPQFEGPSALFTDVPSRPFFPRGFFWDSGFHQHLIGEWDNDLSLDITAHWAALIDANGWVAREQILGDEPRSNVPQEFQTQYPHFANPPTLVTSLLRYVERLEAVEAGARRADSSAKTVQDPAFLREFRLRDPAAARAFLESVYPSFKRQYEWFRRTQWGLTTEFGRSAPGGEAYRWRLDDYPRSSEPHPGELHVDLLCWMAVYSKTLAKIADRVGDHDAAKVLLEQHANMLLSLDELHWDSESQTYADLTVDPITGASVHEVHRGYISLLPLALGLVPHDSTKLNAILDMIQNDLATQFGIASLSPLDPLYGKGENYWRGPIWININYLVLQSLYKNYMHRPGPYQSKARSVYDQVREAVISNVHSEYVRTGYVWEQYDAEMGIGRRSHPFTGWTSLVLLMMSEKY